MNFCRTYLLFFIIVLIKTHVIGQDVWLQNHFSPVSGCNLTAGENVTILINNNSAMFIPGGSITVSYTIDGGAPTNEVLGVGLMPGASWNFTFTVPANLSTCGSHTIFASVSSAGDGNPANNTTTWIVQNDCTITPGSVTADVMVCEASNSGILNLTGWSNGTISDWQYSTNSGASWNSIGNTASSYSFSNLTTTTQYRVQLEGGFCPDAVSGFATITTQAPPTAGVVNANKILCEDSADVNLFLSGQVGSVNFWEYSNDGGANWFNIANTTTTYSFTGSVGDILYRAQIDGGVCPDVYASSALVHVDELSVGGTTQLDQTICEGSSAIVTLSGNNGTILNWEVSQDMSSWTSISNITNSNNTGSLSNTSYYRAMVKNGECDNDTSSVTTITVIPALNGGSLGADINVCAAAASGTLTLTGESGTIQDWEYSTNFGSTWNSLSNTVNTYDYVILTDTTWFRVLIDAGVCGSTYSDTVVVNVIPDSYAGTLLSDTTLCAGGSHTLQLVGSIGDTYTWESSPDNIIWTTISSSPSTLLVSPSGSTYYRVNVQNDICPVDQTATVQVIVNPLPVVDAGLDVQIIEGDTTTLSGSGGLMGIWTPPTGLSDPMIPNPECFTLITATYTYSVIDANNCTNSDMVIVTVNPLSVPKIDIKNVLTANNDGYNDYWILEGIEDFPNTAVKVFNLYGKEVYSSDNYQNDWKGTFEGKNLSDGTYYYIVNIVGEESISGNLTILGHE